MKRTITIIASAMLLVACVAAGELYGDNPSVAEKVARIDAGRRLAKPIDVTRIGALLNQMAMRYGTNDLAVADAVVRAAGIMRESYGIETKLQPLLEDLNGIAPTARHIDALSLVAVAYIAQRNAGTDGAAAVAAVNAAIAATRPAAGDPAGK